MTPIAYYQSQVEKGLIFEDPEQLVAMQHLQTIFYELIAENKKRLSVFAYFRKPVLVKGLYLCGGVGIGKTFMMDCFYETLPFKNKLRMHFHQFMQRVHNTLTRHQGEKDPLQAVADEIANEALVLCFDELFVSDITDAMILGRLFDALFKRGVCLLTTSNVLPDDLYKNGLQRLNFLYAIKLLKLNLKILHIPAITDYRLRHLQSAGVFYSPLSDEASQSMEKSFSVLTRGKQIISSPITIFEREIKVLKRTDDIIWFDFKEICSVPRSQKDYLEIAKNYKTVFISDIPIIDAHEKDTICLFISLVDVLYDARVKLVISAAEPVAEIYSRGFMVMEYTRTHSRLLEMQSKDYFSD